MIILAIRLFTVALTETPLIPTDTKGGGGRRGRRRIGRFSAQKFTRPSEQTEKKRKRKEKEKVKLRM